MRFSSNTQEVFEILCVIVISTERRLRRRTLLPTAAVIRYRVAIMYAKRLGKVAAVAAVAVVWVACGIVYGIRVIKVFVAIVAAISVWGTAIPVTIRVAVRLATGTVKRMETAAVVAINTVNAVVAITIVAKINERKGGGNIPPLNFYRKIKYKTYKQR